MKRKLLASLSLIVEATSAITANAHTLIGAAFLPVVALFFLNTLAAGVGSAPAARIVLALLAMPVYAIFATTIHRVVILGGHSLPNRWGLYWTERETRFLGWFIGIWFLYFAVALTSGIVLHSLTFAISGPAVSWIAMTITYFVVAYFEGRFGLVLPATAIDRRSDFKQAWAMSHGKGGMIALAIFLPAMLLVALEQLLFAGVDEQFVLVVEFVWMVLTIPVFAIEIAIISLAYVKLAD